MNHLKLTKQNRMVTSITLISPVLEVFVNTIVICWCCSHIFKI